MCLRHLAFTLTPFDLYGSGDFDLFLRQGMHEINDLDPSRRQDMRTRFIRAMDASHAVFGEHAFRKQFRATTRRSPVNKALFEAQSVTLSGYAPHEIELLDERRTAVEEGFLRLMEYPDYFNAVSSGTGDVNKVKLRFRLLDEMFREVLSA